ncbi:helix-turn-helix domain-containing protein [Microbacterium testaceum]|uniref:helix-turn-helix domain-containing protein n=1 Tax=Microbacterium testaceum TaxID=2033 RepID=UPI001C9E5274|nr:hypothetical protein [Microbacterium testaceum]
MPFTPVELRNLAVPGDRNDGLSAPVSYRAHELSKRLGAIKVEELICRAEAVESVRSLAREVGVANSALTRMLREHGVGISKRKVSEEEAAELAKGYEAGATIRELQRRHELSQGAVARALRRAGVAMRPSAPRQRT